MQVGVGCYSSYSHTKHMLSKVKAVIWTRKLMTELATVFTNMDGPEKMSLLVTGKSKKPGVSSMQSPCHADIYIMVGHE
jgi:hypothetical protein